MHYQSVRNIAGPHTGPANTVAFGDLSYEERKAKYGAQGKSPALPTPPTTPAIDLKVNDPNEFPALGSTKITTTTPKPNVNPGLAFLDAFDDDSSDDEKKPQVKSSAEKKPVEKTTPTPTPNRNPGLAFLDAFDDDSNSDDEKKPAETTKTEKKVQAKTEPAKKPVTKQALAVQKKAVEKKLAEKNEEEEVKKEVAKKVIRKPSRPPSRKRSHEDLSWLGSESESSDEEEGRQGTASHGDKCIKPSHV